MRYELADDEWDLILRSARRARLEGLILRSE